MFDPRVRGGRTAGQWSDRLSSTLWPLGPLRNVSKEKGRDPKGSKDHLASNMSGCIGIRAI